MRQYEWLGDQGEISGTVVFEPGSRGRVVELDEQIADAAILGGFPLRAVTENQPVNPEKKVTDDGNL